MMFKDIAMIKPYYVVPEKYTSAVKQETEGVEKVIPMPEYKIELPDDKLIKCMAIINQRTWRFITETKIGTNHIISVTDEGKHALHFLSAEIENT